MKGYNSMVKAIILWCQMLCTWSRVDGQIFVYGFKIQMRDHWDQRTQCWVKNLKMAWCYPIISIFRKLRQKDHHEFKARLDYGIRCFSKQTKVWGMDHWINFLPPNFEDWSTDPEYTSESQTDIVATCKPSIQKALPEDLHGKLAN